MFAQSLRNAEDRTCAEIDSIRRWLIKRADVHVSRVTLLVSDTGPAQWVANVLESLLPNLFAHDVTVESRLIRRLQAGDMREGLVEFIRVAAKAIKDSKDRGAQPVVNATPGFKAETSLLTLLGGLLGAETIYLHEHMRDIVSIPVVPLQWRLEKNQVQLLQQIGDAATRDDMRDLAIGKHPGLWSFVERLGEGDEEVWGLSALGQVVIESTTEPVQAPPPKRSEEFRFWKSGDHHLPRDAEQLANDLARRLPFVISATNLKTDGRGTPGLLRPSADDDKSYALRVRIKSQKSDTGAPPYIRYYLRTTAASDAQWQTARRLTAEAFGRVPLGEDLAEDVDDGEAIVAESAMPQELVKISTETRLLGELNRYETKVKERDERIEALNERLRELNEQVATLSRKQNEAAARIHEQQGLIDRRTLELATLNATLEELRGELAAAKATSTTDPANAASPNE